MPIAPTMCFMEARWHQSAEWQGTTQLAPLDLPPTIAISVGDQLACAVAESNDVFCWGRWPRPFDENDPEQEKAPRARTPVRVLVR